MKHGTVQQRLCRLEDDVRRLRASWPIPGLQVATREELERILELATKAAETKGQLRAKISPEGASELSALLETLERRLRTRLGLE